MPLETISFPVPAAVADLDAKLSAVRQVLTPWNRSKEGDPVAFYCTLTRLDGPEWAFYSVHVMCKTEQGYDMARPQDGLTPALLATAPTLLTIAFDRMLIDTLGHFADDISCDEDNPTDVAALITGSGVLLTPDDDPDYERWQALEFEPGEGHDQLCRLVVSAAPSAHAAAARTGTLNEMISWHNDVIASVLAENRIRFHFETPARSIRRD